MTLVLCGPYRVLVIAQYCLIKGFIGIGFHNNNVYFSFLCTIISYLLTY